MIWSHHRLRIEWALEEKQWNLTQNQSFHFHEVVVAEEQMAMRDFSVASRSTWFLIVTLREKTGHRGGRRRTSSAPDLDGLGHGEMNDETNVTLIDSHSEGHSGTDHLGERRRTSREIGISHRSLDIRCRSSGYESFAEGNRSDQHDRKGHGCCAPRDTELKEEDMHRRSDKSLLSRTCSIAFSPRETVDDATLIGIVAVDQIGDLVQCEIGLPFGNAFIDQIGSIEWLKEQFIAARDIQLLKNILLNARGGRGCQQGQVYIRIVQT